MGKRATGARSGNRWPAEETTAHDGGRTSCPGRNFVCSTPIGVRRTTSRSVRSTCSKTRCCASRSSPSTSSPACSATSAPSRAQPDLRAPEPRDPPTRLERDLRRRAGSRRARARRQRLPARARTARSTRTSARRGRATGALPAVLVPGRHPQPRRPGDAWLDPRRRRARLRAHPCLRRGVRQSRPASRLRRRRRRGGDRAPGRELAFEQVPEPRSRRRRPPDPASERLQDREPDRARAGFRSDELVSLFDGLRTPAAARHRRLRRRAAGGRAPALCGCARRGARRDCRNPAPGSGRRGVRTTALADDRPAHTQRAGPVRASSTACRSRTAGAPTRCR